MLDQEDFSTFAKISQALWVDPEASRKSTLDTLAAVSLIKNLPTSEVLERACISLLERSKRAGVGAQISTNFLLNSQALNEPFFRLTAEERLALVALHCGKWSYQRLGRVLNRDRDGIEELLWQARMQLIPQYGYPAGHSYQSADCPEYIAQRPWTQRFLDQEIPAPRDRIFLQSHLVHCLKCRAVLARWRENHFRIDEEMKRKWLSAGAVAEDALATEDQTIKSMLRRKPSQKKLIEMGFFETLQIFVQNSDIQLILIASTFFILSRVLFTS